MKVVFELSGTILFETEMDCPPPVGTGVRFRTTAYKSGIFSGSLVSVIVGLHEPPVYHLSSDEPPEVHISANGLQVIEEGPRPED